MVAKGKKVDYNEKNRRTKYGIFEKEPLWTEGKRELHI